MKFRTQNVRNNQFQKKLHSQILLRVSSSYCSFQSCFDFICSYFELISLAEACFHLIFDFLTPETDFLERPLAPEGASVFSHHNTILFYVTW